MFVIRHVQCRVEDGENGLIMHVTVLATEWPLMAEYIFCISVHFGCKILGTER